MPHHDPTEFPKAHPACEDAMSCQAARLLARAEKAEALLREAVELLRRWKPAEHVSFRRTDTDAFLSRPEIVEMREES